MIRNYRLNETLTIFVNFYRPIIPKLKVTYDHELHTLFPIIGYLPLISGEFIIKGRLIHIVRTSRVELTVKNVSINKHPMSNSTKDSTVQKRLLNDFKK